MSLPDPGGASATGDQPRGSIRDVPLLVVRHARAGRRSAYRGDDRQRPLTARGRAQAEALVESLAPYRPRRILSSPYVRCFETVRPLAVALGVPVEGVDTLAEGHGKAVVRLVERMVGEPAVLCTHGDVADVLLEALAGDRSATVRHELRLLKGEVWVVQSTGTRLAIVDHLHPRPRR